MQTVFIVIIQKSEVRIMEDREKQQHRELMITNLEVEESDRGRMVKYV